MSDLRFTMLVQAGVTGALLLFAGHMESEAPGMAQTVVGAATLHWLKEAAHYGSEAIAERKEKRRNGQDREPRG